MFNVYINSIIKGIKGTVLLYADDILLLNNSKENIIIDKRMIESNLRQLGLIINENKSHLIRKWKNEKVKYLGIQLKLSLSLNSHYDYIKDKVKKVVNDLLYWSK